MAEEEKGATSPETAPLSPAEAHYASRTQPVKTEAPKVETIPDPDTVETPKVEKKSEPKAEAEKSEDAEDKDDEDAEKDGEDKDKEDEEGDDKPKRNRRTLKERNFQLRQQKRDLELRLAEALNRGEKPAETKPEPKAIEAVAPKRPKQEDFENYDAYLEAVVDWKADQKIEQREAQNRKRDEDRQATEEQRTTAQRYAESADKARAKYDDFDDVVSDPKLPVPPHVAAIVANAEDPGELAYWLGTNPQEARRIAALSPPKAAMELGRIESTLAPQAKPREKPKIPETKAPPPTKTVPQGNARPSARRLEGLPQDDYYARRTAQLKSGR
jgi:hypothetical protein